jgi:hypothetical protein
MKYFLLLLALSFSGIAHAAQFTVTCPMSLSMATQAADIVATDGSGKIRFHGDITSDYNGLSNISGSVVSSNGTTVDLKCRYKYDYVSKIGFPFDLKQTVNATSCVALGGPFAPPYTFSCVN